MGCIQVRVNHNGQGKEHQLLVVQGEGPSLLGCDWLRELRLDWGAVHKSGAQDQLQAILDDYSDLFKEDLGLIRGVKAKIHVSQQAKPCFCKLRAVPFSLRKAVDSELERLEKEGIIEPVAFSEWAALTVPVLKDDGSIRWGLQPSQDKIKVICRSPWTQEFTELKVFSPISMGSSSTI